MKSLRRKGNWQSKDSRRRGGSWCLHPSSGEDPGLLGAVPSAIPTRLSEGGEAHPARTAPCTPARGWGSQEVAFSSKGARAAPVQPGAQPWSRACVRPGVCECLSLRAGVPKCRRQPVYVGPVLAWQTRVQGDFPWGPGGLQGGRQPWGAAEPTGSTGLPGATGVGRAWGSVDAVRFFLSLRVPGLRSSARLDGRLRGP